MPMTHDAQARGLARTAYRTLEPYHVLAYFAPLLRDLATEWGMHWRTQYVGMRAAPMGEVSAAVVAAAFYNFKAEEVARAWERAEIVGLGRLDAQRDAVLDRTLRDILGEAADSEELAELADRFRDVAQAVPRHGRPLGAAWADRDWPAEPHLSLWQASAVCREWRGDGHVAALVLAGLDPVEALHLNVSRSLDGTRRGHLLGARRLQRSRGWTPQEWAAGEQRLLARGLVEPADGPADPDLPAHRLTPAGAALAGRIEEQTDDAAASIWVGVPDAAELFQRVRPFVTKVIDAGIVPGTRRKE